MRYGMIVDLKRCVGCHTCSVACRFANNLPAGTWWNHVYTEGGSQPDTAFGEFPNLSINWLPVTCQHCDDPACVKVCPVGATYKDPETGIVRQDYDKCIGCRMCMAACPYPGVRAFNWSDPNYTTDSTFGDVGVASHQRHVVEKCTFCYQRLARDEKPACVESCPERARFFGDLDDPGSEVASLLKKRSSNQLLPERGTKPTTHYLV